MQFAAAQDLHFTQLTFATPLLNPALTGAFRGDTRIGAHYRSQWWSVPVDYRTSAFRVDQRLFLPNIKMGNVSAGLFVRNDQAGELAYRQFQLGLSSSYAHPIHDGGALRAGVHAVLQQTSFSTLRATFDEQWNGDFFDASANITESLTPNPNESWISLSAGLGYQWLTPEGRMDVGLAVFHWNRPEPQFVAGNAVVPLRYTVLATGEQFFNDRLGASAQLMGMLQAGIYEARLGGGLLYRLRANTDAEWVLHPQFHYRIGDALLAALEVRHLAWTVGLAYDVNISDFRVATGGRGAVELAVQYRIVKVRPPEELKVCPVF